MPFAALTGQTRRTGIGRYNRSSIGQKVGEAITIVVNAIADLRVSIRNAEVPVACIAQSVVIGIVLTSVDDLRTVVTRISDTVFIFIGLIGIGHIGAVIINAA